MIQRKTFCDNYLCIESFFPFIVLKKLSIFIFPTVKMSANYANIFRVGTLVAGLQQVSLVQNF